MSEGQMKKSNKKDTSFAMIIVALLLSSIFILSGAFKQISAQSSNNSKAETAANNYNTFKNCLSNADSTKGYATKKEIRQCITQAYPPPLNSTSSPNTNTGVVTSTSAG
jgi:ABC-type bacteriocin/lantibiotic exporter with double-glycine peptidase domain